MIEIILKFVSIEKKSFFGTLRRLHGALDYITSPGIIIPVFVLMVSG